MVFENRIYLKIIIKIASTILIVILLALTGLRMYGASLVSDANHEQSILIKNCPSATRATSVIDSIMRSYERYNVFIFKDCKMRIVEKTVGDVDELKKLKIYDENDKCFVTRDSRIGEYVTFKQKDNGGDCYLSLNIQNISSEKIVEENSFSGSFFRLTYGYSLPRTLLDILEQLTALKKDDKKGYLGVSFFEGHGQSFFYHYQMKNIELGLQFEGLDDKVKALDVFSYLLDIENDEYVQEKVDRLNMNERGEDQRPEMDGGNEYQRHDEEPRVHDNTAEMEEGERRGDRDSEEITNETKDETSYLEEEVETTLLHEDDEITLLYEEVERTIRPENNTSILQEDEIRSDSGNKIISADETHLDVSARETDRNKQSNLYEGRGRDEEGVENVEVRILENLPSDGKSRSVANLEHPTSFEVSGNESFKSSLSNIYFDAINGTKIRDKGDDTKNPDKSVETTYWVATVSKQVKNFHNENPNESKEYGQKMNPAITTDCNESVSSFKSGVLKNLP